MTKLTKNNQRFSRDILHLTAPVDWQKDARRKYEH